VCVAPLQLKELRGKESTPRFGWEVPVKSHRSEIRSSKERGRQQLEVGDFDYGTHVFILHGRLFLTLRFHICTFNFVKKVLDLAF
jgi:hypothetical protein